jgi:FkbM family methyltransferase
MHPPLRSSSFPGAGEFFYISKVETAFMAKGIWNDRIYDGGAPLQLPPDAVVVDAGANIGLFSLYIHSLRLAGRPRILAFEPIPAIFAALEANVRRRGAGSQVRLFNVGLSERAGTATFHFYKNLAACSSVEDRDSELREISETQDVPELLRTFYPAVHLVYRYVPFLRAALKRAIMRSALAKETVQCPLITLSQLIADEKLDRIDLLKIDVERSELPVLRGIAEEDWPKIRRIVVEVNLRGECEPVAEILRAHGFTVREAPEIAECTILHGTRPA